MKIIFTKQVIFREFGGKILKQFNIGDTVEYSTFNNIYYVTSWGSIWADEAEILV